MAEVVIGSVLWAVYAIVAVFDAAVAEDLLQVFICALAAVLAAGWAWRKVA